MSCSSVLYAFELLVRQNIKSRSSFPRGGLQLLSEPLGCLLTSESVHLCFPCLLTFVEMKKGWTDLQRKVSPECMGPVLLVLRPVQVP